MRPDELTASADMVRWNAVLFANGVRTVFYHSADNPALRNVSTYNIFFQYGGAPRKMYPAVAVMSRMLGPDFEFVQKWDKPENTHAYEFRSRGRTVVVVWTRKSKRRFNRPGSTASCLPIRPSRPSPGGSCATKAHGCRAAGCCGPTGRPSRCTSSSSGPGQVAPVAAIVPSCRVYQTRFALLGQFAGAIDLAGLAAGDMSSLAPPCSWRRTPTPPFRKPSPRPPGKARYAVDIP